MSDKCNEKVEELTRDSQNGFSCRGKPILQLNLLSNTKKFENFCCEIIFHKILNQVKGIIYIQNCEFIDYFKRGPLVGDGVINFSKWIGFRQSMARRLLR